MFVAPEGIVTLLPSKLTAGLAWCQASCDRNWTGTVVDLFGSVDVVWFMRGLSFYADCCLSFSANVFLASRYNILNCFVITSEILIFEEQKKKKRNGSGRCSFVAKSGCVGAGSQCHSTMLSPRSVHVFCFKQCVCKVYLFFSLVNIK